jgi:hypothetical protein
MYPHSPLWHYLWVAPYVLQLVVLVVMWRRGLMHKFPMFVIYTAAQALQGGVLFFADHSEFVSIYHYRQAEVTFTIISHILRFALIYEIFSNVFRPYPSLEQIGSLILRWGGALLLIAGIAIMVYSPGAGFERMDVGLMFVGRTVSLIQIGLLVILFLFSSYLGITWRNLVFGIALGLGLFSTVDLAVAALRVQSVPNSMSYFLDFGTMATYHICVVVWLCYILAKEEVRSPVQHVPENNLEQWNAELERLLLQ